MNHTLAQHRFCNTETGHVSIYRGHTVCAAAVSEAASTSRSERASNASISRPRRKVKYCFGPAAVPRQPCPPLELLEFRILFVTRVRHIDRHTFLHRGIERLRMDGFRPLGA